MKRGCSLARPLPSGPVVLVVVEVLRARFLAVGLVGAVFRVRLAVLCFGCKNPLGGPWSG